jgi:hypothetical protein
MNCVQGLDIPQTLKELRFTDDAVFTDMKAFSPAFKH